MSAPTLAKTSVAIHYTSSNGHSMGYLAKSGKGNHDPKSGVAMPPEQALLAGLEELARLTALFGFEEEALQAFNRARQRVAEWKDSQKGGA